MRWGLLAMRWLGMLALVGSLYQIGANVGLWAFGERTQGVVVAAYDAPMTDSERRDLSARNVRSTQVESLAEAIDIRFETSGGREVSFTPPGGVSKNTYAPGDSVTVLYDPDDPEGALLLGFRPLLLGPLLLGFMGAVFWAIGWLGKILSEDAVPAKAAASRP
ncbi:MAG: DUF3592 domain-containing protein [Acidobacteria bacterium]|nr:DUF3592 domain-containing protein [Acidobacteriota bacterium]